ncbi:2-methylcitrate dehydratase PrpD [Streptomyces sp. 3211.6]|uniref:MmgE/PrpD family protein n=1 Tax=Streptomyces sp. 3211.6 TaxID=1938845 RepID=UPI000EB26882|nr:MmgE/PrpD family protein [Streptomyces sp. 3211.6]RKT07834.1 2-methylcitrate dehydratase PrpD [Streptomyces sp. 3211.6]
MTRSQPGPAPLVHRLAAFAAEARDRGLPGRLRAEAAERILDCLGNSLLAQGEPAPRAVLAVAREWGGTGPAHVLGSHQALAVPAAALVNGTLAHAMDFDDSHMLSVLHPSASVIPAALAVAEATGAGGPQLLDAVTVGTEVCIRLGIAGYDPDLGNSLFFERGQHATSICGTLGAAVAAALLLGADEDTIAAALGIAASTGAGLLEANRTGGTVKRMHCGWAAHAGVAAAQLARAGITGPPTVLEGRFGFFQAWCGDRARPEAVLDGLGERWETSEIIVKPYPCNHFTHPGIDAALRLRDQGVRAEDVVHGELRVPTAMHRTIGEPATAKAAPATGYAAAFSGPFTVATALLGGGGLGVWFEDFTDAAAHDPARRALAALIRCVPDPGLDPLFPTRLPAVLRVTTRDGRTHEIRVDTSKGGPDVPLTTGEREHKFRLSAGTALPPARVDAVLRAVRALPEGGNATDLLALCSSPAA